MSKRDQFNVKYDGSKYDIATFLKNHPGGINYMRPYEEKEVAKRMQDSAHSKAAYYLLREYREGGRDTGDRSEKDKDLETLVNWDEPMLCQVGDLGIHYTEWVNLPVDRRLRIFGNPILESITITPWFVVPLVWIPVIISLIYLGTKRYVELTNDPNPFYPTIWNIGFGVFLWTLLEYSLHRWVFHIEPSGKSKAMIYFHFAIHGLHHKTPFDKRRLVFPPVPAAGIVYVVYSILYYFIPQSRILHMTAGVLLGYVIYDMIHFYLHYGAPKESSYLYNLKRIHNQHHFAHHNSGFGISSVLWDKIFFTGIQLKKLSSGIKW